MTTMERGTLEHARENARGWLESIHEMVARLEHAQDHQDSDECSLASNESDMSFIDFASQSWEFAAFHDADAAREAIEESVLSVRVRSPWRNIGETGNLLHGGEYEILLTTGGPALRIIGQIGDDYAEPVTATLEMQDWGTPWTDYIVPGTSETLLTFARCFYFGG